MKITIESPDPVLRKATSKAAERGQTLKAFVNEALVEKLAAKTSKATTSEPEWMRGFGKLHDLKHETRSVQARIDEAFDVMEPEDRE